MELIEYAGAKRKVAPAQLASLERRGFVAQPKADGAYLEVHVGALQPGQRGGGGRVQLAVYRSGRLLGRDSGRDLLGVRVPWAPGTVVCGEFMIGTPEARRWQDANHGIKGFVAFDVLRVGDWKIYASSRSMNVAGAPFHDLARRPYRERYGELERLVGQLEGPAARAIHLVPTWRTRLRERFESVVDAGGEGLVLRDVGAPVGAGTLKCKRRDAITCRVVEVLPEERVVRLAWGSTITFAVNMPGFELAPGDMVDVIGRGFNEGGVPRHAAIARVRHDLAVTPCC